MKSIFLLISDQDQIFIIVFHSNGLCLYNPIQDEDLTFQEVWINCMSLSQSSNIYQKIATHISNESLTYRESEQYLEKVIQSKGPKM